jgi:hypothetical protein
MIEPGWLICFLDNQLPLCPRAVRNPGQVEAVMATHGFVFPQGSEAEHGCRADLYGIAFDTKTTRQRHLHLTILAFNPSQTARGRRRRASSFRSGSGR